MSQLCTWSPNKLWRSDVIFNLCSYTTKLFCRLTEERIADFSSKSLPWSKFRLQRLLFTTVCVSIITRPLIFMESHLAMVAFRRFLLPYELSSPV
jgi:hypothetical protein